VQKHFRQDIRTDALGNKGVSRPSQATGDEQLMPSLAGISVLTSWPGHASSVIMQTIRQRSCAMPIHKCYSLQSLVGVFQCVSRVISRPSGMDHHTHVSLCDRSAMMDGRFGIGQSAAS
jgi:hypothetical protein